MFKDEYPQGTEDYRVQGCDHSQIICLWLVSGSTLALVYQCPIQESARFVSGQKK